MTIKQIKTLKNNSRRFDNLGRGLEILKVGIPFYKD